MIKIKKPKLAISFSMGETSALMTYKLLKEKKGEYDITVIMSNTGKEVEKSLEFAEKCDKAFGFNTVWIEAKVNPEYRKGTSYSLTNFKDAKRNGEPFEDMIKKFGIPNQAFKHCSRELKGQPIKKFINDELGRDTKIAIGIRADEIDRLDEKAKEHNIIYPLVTDNISKIDVNRFWKQQGFRLEIKGYEGNCNKCWKKSLRKLMTIEKEEAERGEHDDWYIDMEAKYGNYIPKERLEQQISKGKETKLPIVFYRNNLSGKEIREMALTTKFKTAQDDKIIFDKQGNLFDLDQAGDCSESYEVKFN